MTPTARFAEALAYAVELHAQQKRKGTEIPYAAHLLAVCAIAMEHGANEEEAIAAVLHDAIEDQGGARTGAEIERRFGAGVRAIVEGCTDADVVPKPPWRARKEKYVAHLADASPSVLLVSASDKLHNARAILADLRELGDAVWSRFTGGKEGTLWYYRSLVEAFRPRAHPRLVAELDRVVSEMERLAER